MIGLNDLVMLPGWLFYLYITQAALAVVVSGRTLYDTWKQRPQVTKTESE